MDFSHCIAFLNTLDLKSQVRMIAFRIGVEVDDLEIKNKKKIFIHKTKEP